MAARYLRASSDAPSPLPALTPCAAPGRFVGTKPPRPVGGTVVLRAGRRGAAGSLTGLQWHAVGLA